MSISKWLGLPEKFLTTILVFFLLLSARSYLLGPFKIKDWDVPALPDHIRIVGPIGFALVILLFVPFFKSGPDKTKHARASDILGVVQDLSELSNRCLMENQVALQRFIGTPTWDELFAATSQLKTLYENQRDRHKFAEFEAFLKVQATNESDKDIQTELGRLERCITRLRGIFYSSYDAAAKRVHYDTETITKIFVVEVLGRAAGLSASQLQAGLYRGPEAAQVAKQYLSSLRTTVVNVSSGNERK